MPRAHRVLSLLYPDAHAELDHTSAWELLVATVLSAQTTDVRVNTVTPAIFSRWPGPAALAGAPEPEVSEIVRPLGMGARRAHQIITLSAQLCAEHAGEVPDDQASLEALAGVGRKTAHVVRGTWFGHSLLTVDTHVGRLARRFGWSTHASPAVLETDVVALAETSADSGTPIDLTQLSHQMIWHGRRVCSARRPSCDTCPLALPAARGEDRTFCPRIGV